MIYLPEKVKIHQVNTTFKGRWILMPTEIEVNNCFVIWRFTFVVKDIFNI